MPKLPGINYRAAIRALEKGSGESGISSYS